jgi:hypothetical protein
MLLATTLNLKLKVLENPLYDCNLSALPVYSIVVQSAFKFSFNPVIVALNGIYLSFTTS